MRRFLLLCSLGLLAAVGCEKVVGVSDLKIVHGVDAGADASPDGADGGPACTADDGGLCGQCIEQNCCAAALACSQDPTCALCLDTTSPPAGCDDTNARLKAYADCAQKCPACLTP